MFNLFHFSHEVTICSLFPSLIGLSQSVYFFLSLNQSVPSHTDFFHYASMSFHIYHFLYILDYLLLSVYKCVCSFLLFISDNVTFNIYVCACICARMCACARVCEIVWVYIHMYKCGVFSCPHSTLTDFPADTYVKPKL